VAWWYLVFPALALLIATLAFNLLGDGIRDALDPGAERLLGRAGGRRQRRSARRQLRRQRRPAGSLTRPGTGWTGHMILPWITLATVSAAVYSRLSRSSLLETLGEDYIRTARAKGLAERRVVLGHAMRSALTPVVSQLGIDVGTLLGGVVVVETVFGIGGIGQDSVEAIDQGNLPLIIGFVLAAAVFVIVANILVDIAYTLLDPRVLLS
jgi:peptide/nickel transport system permease protein